MSGLQVPGDLNKIIEGEFFIGQDYNSIDTEVGFIQSIVDKRRAFIYVSHKEPSFLILNQPTYKRLKAILSDQILKEVCSEEEVNLYEYFLGCKICVLQGENQTEYYATYR